MKKLNPSWFLLAVLFFSLFATNEAQFQILSNKLLTVNDVGDSVDTNIGDGLCLDSNGKCTLRTAIQEANDAGFNVINFALPQNSIINLTLGELLITKPLEILGSGARNLTVQRSFNSDTPQFRIFKIQNVVQSINIRMRGLTIKNGNTQSDGGAFFIDYGNVLQLTEVAISNNTAASGGGIFGAGTLEITRSIINSNISTGQFGGGIVNLSNQGTSIITNSTLTDNSGNRGGAIYNSGNLLLINNTISHNAANNSGSSVSNDSNGTANVLNTIIGTDAASASSSLSGAFNSVGNNLITDARNSTGFANGVNNDQISDNNVINPLLGNLANNGGQTDTRNLLKGSPAINRGNNCVTTSTCPTTVPPQIRLTSDQRNFLRSDLGVVDVGSIESDSLGSINRRLSFGTFSSRPRLSGSLAILTNPRTNEKIYRTLNPFGNFLFSNLNLEVYILEIKSKRAGLSRVSVFEFDNLPRFVPTDSENFIENSNLVERMGDQKIFIKAESADLSPKK